MVLSSNAAGTGLVERLTKGTAPEIHTRTHALSAHFRTHTHAHANTRTRTPPLYSPSGGTAIPNLLSALLTASYRRITRHRPRSTTTCPHLLSVILVRADKVAFITETTICPPSPLLPPPPAGTTNTPPPQHGCLCLLSCPLFCLLSFRL
jgi:hypothetical protein